MAWRCTGVLVAGLLFGTAFPAVALGESNTVSVVLAGEAYDGPPTFKVTLNGEVIGEGAVDKAIDTVNAGRLVVNGVSRAAPQAFRFDVPASKFNVHAVMQISMTNDKYDNVNKVGDRNLYVVSANINGREIGASDFTLSVDGKPSDAPLVAKMVALWDNTDVAIVQPPAEGWPVPKEQVSGPNVKASTDTAKTPVPVAGTAVGTAAVTAGPAAKATQPVCNLSLDFAVAGFPQNATQLSASQTKQLQALVQELQGQSCSILVAGYADVAGSKEVSRITARDRAAAVLDFLDKQGVRFRRSDLTAFGATAQFGPTTAANRRVLVHIVP